jgi:hypothetical protein
MVVLHHPDRVTGGWSEPIQGGVQICWAVHDFATGRAHPGRRHDVLGERLGALDAGGILTGSETGDAGSPHRVGHPKHQRHLGADDYQVGPDLARQGDDVLAGGDVDIVLLCQPGGAGVAGSDG